MSVKPEIIYLLALFFSAFSPPLLSEQLTPQEMEEWLFDDSDSLTEEVNEGELVFLQQSPKKQVHHHHNSILISDNSVEDGWISLKQCHRNLDPISLAQIVFRQDRVRGLKVDRINNIDMAWVEGASIQLQGVKRNALLCIRAETRSFVYNGDGTYSLHSGPFMRRFLDGYYPMRVTLDVSVDSERLRFYRMTPASQAGFDFRHSDRSVHFEALFEGRLRTEIMFHDLAPGNVSAQQQGRGKIAEDGRR
ncbi:alpha/beta hydrolase [Sulfuriflexus sp.]|uniref:alpha/beta hydrolase n=1 Tax=Sulfuriflexus sp. TaxID=2015443 RepID=UPI0028CCA9B7|nr:alpha/beta hydrolase [Sulfuriflexus sp.]MDT8403959.1 alpha/beta hydrolase [Sulfuriflexus sp.]